MNTTPTGRTTVSPLQAAVQMFSLGRLADAEDLCRKILQTRPDDFDGLHLLGLIAAQTRRGEWAVELLEKAIRRRQNVPSIYNNLGNVLRELKRGEQAVVQYSRALALRGDFAEAHQGRGLARLDLNDAAGASTDFESAIRLRPDDARAHCALAAALLALNRPEAALESSTRALALQPADAAAHANRAAALQRLGRPAEALESSAAAIASDPSMAAAHNVRAAALLELLRPEEALASIDRAFAIAPGYASAHVNRAGALIDLQRPAEAIASATAAIELQPRLAAAHVNRGIALQASGQPAQALVSLEQAARLDPESAEAHFNQALCHLQLGQFQPGWKLYEWRRRIGRQPAQPQRPVWTGSENIRGKRLLLQCEQGLGDTIQFCRLAKLLGKLGAHVILSVQADVCELVRSLDRSIEVIDQNAVPGDVDYQLPLASVPHALGLSLSDIPGEAPYLFADPQRIHNWRLRLQGDAVKVGICWQGSRNKIDLGRSIPLAEFFELGRIAQVRLISLQKGYGTEQLDELPAHVSIEAPAQGLGPQALQDLAALICTLDVVISSDTLIAHLAAALGVETWIALKFAPDWRWMLERKDCPWYPTARLFRQPRIAAWRPVFERIGGSLQAFVDARLQAP